MENFEATSDLYVTPHRPPPYTDNLQTPTWNDQRFYHEQKVDVRQKTGARKKLVNIFQNPMFGKGGSGQPPHRPWKEAAQAAQAYPEFGQGGSGQAAYRSWKEAKEETRKISPYMRNKLSGRFHNLKHTGAKVMNNSFYK